MSVAGYSNDETKIVSEDLPVLVFGDHTRHFKYLDRPFVPGADGVKVLKPIGVHPKWLFHIAHAIEFADKGYARHFQHLKSARLPVPPSHEQSRIVAEIEKQFTRLDVGVVSLTRVQANLKRYRSAVLAAGCAGQLFHDRGHGGAAERMTHFQPNSHQNLHRVPAGWSWTTVGKLLIQKPCNGISVKGSDNLPGIRSLRLSAMSDGGFDYSDVRYLPLSPPDVDDLWIEPGDFFVSRGNGSLKLVGRGTTAQASPEPTIFPDTMIRLRLRDEIRQTQWLSTIWPSHLVRKQIETLVKTTAGIYKISQPELLSIHIPLPPLDEQTRIVADIKRRFSVIDTLENVIIANLQRARTLRQSILHRAFLGNL